MDDKDTEALGLLAGLIARARAHGADAADALLYDATSLSVSQRLNRPERLERSESGDLGLRVFVGRKMAIVSSSDRGRAALDELADRAVAMARAVPEDPFCGIAEPEQLATEIADLDLYDPVEPTAEELIERARMAEAAALAVPGVTNSDGAEAGWGRTRIALAASNGFAGAYAATRHSISASVIAGEGSGMETDYDFSSAVHAGDLTDPAVVGRSAGERAVARLGSRKVGTMKAPVVFDPRVGGSLIGSLTGAISGPAIARGTSFLKDSMGQQILPPGVTITDDPHRRRGLRSKPFDGEGVANRRRQIVADGRLETWLLDLRSARQLGLQTTAHAARGTGSPPGPAPTNLYLEPGTASVEELIADIDQGLYVTQMMGTGANLITGNYSRGAAGFWIERGQITYPVNEITVAGNLKQMFLALTPANDLVFRYGINAPTLRIDGMTIAGK